MPPTARDHAGVVAVSWTQLKGRGIYKLYANKEVAAADIETRFSFTKCAI